MILSEYRFGANVDWENPLRSIAATVDADVLKALAGTHEPVTGNQLAHLAGRSYAQVYAVCGRLVDDGMVRRVRYGRTNTYRLNRDHVLSPIIDRMLAAPARVESEIRQAGLAWMPAAEAIALAGPAARRAVAPGAAVDIVVVRGDRADPGDPAWRTQVGELVRRVEEMSGNPVQLIETSGMGLRAAIRDNQPGSGSLRQGVRTIVGVDLRRIMASTGDRERWVDESTM
jgi:hypothetical protein